MASPTQWTWVWVSSGNWWWTGRPGVLQFMGSQRVRHDWATELNQDVSANSYFIWISLVSKIMRFLLSLCSPGFCDYFYVCVCMHVCAKSLQSVRLFATVWTVAHLAPLPVGFSRQEYWSGWPCPSRGDLPNPETELMSPALKGGFFTTSTTWEAPILHAVLPIGQEQVLVFSILIYSICILFMY